MKENTSRFRLKRPKKKTVALLLAAVLVLCAGGVALRSMGGQQAEAGKTLGQSAMVGGNANDPLVTGDSSAQTGSTQDAQNGDAQTSAQAETGSEYFATARLNRQQARDSALSLLQDAAAREDADETVKTQVNDTIQTMADYTVTEAQIENLVIAKGYADCVAFIGEDALSLAVAAPEGGLTEADTAKIVDVVNQSAGFTADQIKIIEVE